MNTENSVEIAREYGKLLTHLSAISINASEMANREAERVRFGSYPQSDGEARIRFMQDALVSSIEAIRRDLIANPVMIDAITEQKGATAVATIAFSKTKLPTAPSPDRMEALKTILRTAAQSVDTVYETVGKAYGQDVLRAALKEQARGVQGSLRSLIAADRSHTPAKEVDRAEQLAAAERFGASLTAHGKARGFER